MQIAAAAPGRSPWSAHLVDDADGSGACGYDHARFHPLREADGITPPPVEVARLVDDLVAWSTAAGLTTTAAAVEAAVAADGLMYQRYAGLVAALGLPPGRMVAPWFDFAEPEWDEAVEGAWLAGSRVCRRWTEMLHRRAHPGAPTGHLPFDVEQPGDGEYLAFLDRLGAAMYGDGHSRQELAEQAGRCTTAYPWRT